MTFRPRGERDEENPVCLFKFFADGVVKPTPLGGCHWKDSALLSTQHLESIPEDESHSSGSKRISFTWKRISVGLECLSTIGMFTFMDEYGL